MLHVENMLQSIYIGVSIVYACSCVQQLLSNVHCNAKDDNACVCIATINKYNA